MKTTNILFVTILVFAACNNNPRMKIPQTGNFGNAFTESNPLNVEQLATSLDSNNTFQTQVLGTVSSYCKGEGCWLVLKNNDGEDLFVNVKDKAFVLPYNIEGKTAIVTGIAIKDSSAGKIELSIEAEGIIIK